jgi:hypothetical protein
MAYKLNGIHQLGGENEQKETKNPRLKSYNDSLSLYNSYVEKIKKFKTGVEAGTTTVELGDTSSNESIMENGIEPTSYETYSSNVERWFKTIPVYKKPISKPKVEINKMATKGIAKGNKVQPKIKNATKPKVKHNFYSAASQLKKQGKPVGYTETTLPGASRVLRNNISANEYKK